MVSADKSGGSEEAAGDGQGNLPVRREVVLLPVSFAECGKISCMGKYEVHAFREAVQVMLQLNGLISPC
jgi:hypothetical protein